MNIWLTKVNYIFYPTYSKTVYIIVFITFIIKANNYICATLKTTVGSVPLLNERT